jgi:hypothetical protein
MSGKEVPINLLAVLAAAAASFVIGGIWHGPLFGEAWIRLSGHNKAAMSKIRGGSIARSLALQGLGSLVTAWVLAHVVVFATAYMGNAGLEGGVRTAFYTWLGFNAPAMMGAQLWDGKPWALFAINSGYYLVSLTVQAAILALWV